MPEKQSFCLALTKIYKAGMALQYFNEKYVDGRKVTEFMSNPRSKCARPPDDDAMYSVLQQLLLILANQPKFCRITFKFVGDYLWITQNLRVNTRSLVCVFGL
jgi:hypothetical protein